MKTCRKTSWCFSILKHGYPTGVDISQPINQMPPTWQSKYPIYYAFAGVSSLLGLATWQVLATLAAAMLGLAAVGMFLVARDVLGAPVAAALVGMAVAGLNREALHTILNSYFNQTWGFFATPFTLVLGWWVVQPGLGRRQRQATAVLLALFALMLVFAYPLAAPIPAVAIAAFVWSEWRRKLRAGEPMFHPRDLYNPVNRRRSLLWLIPLCALLVVPAIGVGQKVAGAVKVLAPATRCRPGPGICRASSRSTTSSRCPDCSCSFRRPSSCSAWPPMGCAAQGGLWPSAWAA